MGVRTDESGRLGEAVSIVTGWSSSEDLDVILRLSARISASGSFIATGNVPLDVLIEITTRHSIRKLIAATIEPRMICCRLNRRFLRGCEMKWVGPAGSSSLSQCSRAESASALSTVASCRVPLVSISAALGPCRRSSLPRRLPRPPDRPPSRSGRRSSCRADPPGAWRPSSGKRRRAPPARRAARFAAKGSGLRDGPGSSWPACRRRYTGRPVSR